MGYDFNCQRFSVGLYNSLANTHKPAYQWYSFVLKPFFAASEGFRSQVVPIQCTSPSQCFEGGKCAIENGEQKGECIPELALRPGDPCQPTVALQGYCYKGHCDIPRGSATGTCKAELGIKKLGERFTFYNIMLILLPIGLVAIAFCIYTRMRRKHPYSQVGLMQQPPPFMAPRTPGFR